MAKEDEVVDLEEKSTETEEIVEEEVDTMDDYLLEDDIDLKSDNESVFMPSNTSDARASTLVKLSVIEEKDIGNTLGDNAIAAYMNAHEDVINRTKDTDVYEETLEKNDFTNEISYGEKSINIRSAKTKPKSSRKLTGDLLVTAVSKSVGSGDLTTIPLYNSGFNIMLKPFESGALANLEDDLNKNQVYLGRKTSGLIYSNYSIVFYKIVIDFIVAHIVKTSLKIPVGKEVTDFIKVTDLYPMTLGLIHSMYPRGYEILRSCSNSNVVDDETRNIECGSTIAALIDASKLLRVNKSMLTQDHLMQLAKTTPDCLSEEEVLHYQDTLPVSGKITKKAEIVKTNTSIEYDIELPNLTTFVTAGMLWVESISASLEEMMSSNDDTNSVQERVDKIITITLLGVYNSYITEVRLEDGIITGLHDITRALSIYSSEDEFVDGVLDSVKKYIVDNSISIVALPDYTCKACKGKQTSDTPFVSKSLIPINTVTTFLDLRTQRLKRLTQR